MKVKYGQGVAEMRGKLGGTVFSRNASGAYARNNVKPINPRTAAQQANRARFASIASAYRMLDASQQASFELQKTNYPQKDKLGNTITLTAQQLYNKTNMQLRSLGLERSISVMPPPLEQVGDVFLQLTVTSASMIMFAQFTTYQGGIITVTQDVPTGYAFVLEATRPVSPGVNALKDSDYKQILVVSGSTPVPEDPRSSYEAVFGAIPRYSKIGFRAKLVYLANAQSSPYTVTIQTVNL